MKRILVLVIAFSLIFAGGVIAAQKRPLVLESGRSRVMKSEDQVHFGNIPTDESTLERDGTGKAIRLKADGIKDTHPDWGSGAGQIDGDDMPSGSTNVWPPIKKLDANAAPGVDDDVDPAGYGPGSIWVDVTADKSYVCLDGTDGAAVWKEITTAQEVNKYDANVAPTVDDDVDPAGYTPGSLWVDVTADKAYVCLDSTDGAAIWTETTQPIAGQEVNNYDANAAPGVDDDVDPAGYMPGSEWIDTTADKAYVCLDSTNGAAVWLETTAAASDSRGDGAGAFETVVLTAEGAVVGSDIAQQVVGGSGVIAQYEIEFEDADYADDSEAFWTFVMPDNYAATFNGDDSIVTIWYYNEGTPCAEVTFAIGWRTWTIDTFNPTTTDVVDWNTTIDTTATTQNLVHMVAETNFNPDWVAGDMVTFGLKRLGNTDAEDDTINFLRLKIEYPVDHVFSGN